MSKICGALGCRNEADGKIPHNGRLVWTCEQCAGARHLLKTEGER